MNRDDTIYRTYKGKHVDLAMKEMAKDAVKYPDYRVTSQIWDPGKSGCLRFLLLGPFAFFVRPKGYLSVTYTRDQS